MRKKAIVIAPALALVFGYVAITSATGEMSSKAAGTSGIKDLLGGAVMNPQAEVLGVITDFVKESDGRITFVTLNFGTYEDYGEGGRMVAVPFDALSCAGHNCTIHSDYQKLASSPVFYSKDELTERKLEEDVYRYFGVQPYWEEKIDPEIEKVPEYY
jgi:hypothetical protein